MKKSLFMLGAALLALSSCTQNEVLDVNESRTIDFDGFIGKPTRAETTNENITSFQVFGGFDSQYTNVFNDVAVNRQGDGSGSPYTWVSETTQYWQANKIYTFNAYSPKGNGTVSVSADGISINGFNASAGTTDLIIADTKTVNTGDIGFNMDSPTKVQFKFNHVLSMIKFTFSTDLAGVNITISDLKVESVPCQGNYSSTGWSTSSSTANYALTVVSPITNTSAQASTEAIVIPQTPNSLKVTFKVTATGSLDIQNAKHEVTLPSTAWTKGNRYNYTAKITAENIDPENPLKPIEFDTPKEELWVDASPEELPDYETTQP